MKNKLCKENNYIMIRIDCEKSELEYIKNNTLNSDLNQLFDLSKIDWGLCHKNSLISKVIEAWDLWNSGINNTTKIGNILNLNRHTIVRYLHKGRKIGLCSYCPIEAQINNGKTSSRDSQIKKIICLTTNEIFKSVSSAARFYNMIGTGGISDCCNGKSRSCGKHPVTGEKLVWEHYNPEVHQGFIAN